VIATDVGGQREIRDPLLQLVDVDADPESLAERLAALPLRTGLLARPAKRMPRLWSVGLSARPAGRTDLDTLFVTANLNAGGAQRSLVNLAGSIASRHRIAIAVCADTTYPAFAAALAQRGIEHFRPAADADVFALAESLLSTAAFRGARNLCFWNASPRVKLLVAKFAPPALRVIDVSPGDYSFREMEGASEFAEAIAYPADAYYERLDHMVLKFHSKAAVPCARVSVIPNGVAPMPAQPNAGSACFLVCGRIAPSKRLEVVIEAFRALLDCVPTAQLHFVGPCEPREREYGERILALAAGLPVYFHGAVADAGALHLRFAATVVLGTNQGSPNAILEAMASGIPVIANASGGTGELVIDGQTGWLLEEGADAAAVARAMRAAVADPGMAAACAARARERVASRFSLETMAESYLRLLVPEATPVREKMAPCRSDSAPVAAPPLPSAPSPATAVR
jgi:glycosyltransferase involved in cell wall biosynthesis